VADAMIEAGRFFWKWPKQLPYPVTVSFAAPLPATATALQVQQVVMALGSAAMAYRPKTTTPLPQRNQA
jgi:acyl-[acyl-carrier-protein]-phospholipid O-acyltransferase / long-chain-fatty-acid--[acyl-carrier-protein] ligase